MRAVRRETDDGEEADHGAIQPILIEMDATVATIRTGNWTRDLDGISDISKGCVSRSAGSEALLWWIHMLRLCARVAVCSVQHTVPEVRDATV